MRRDPATGCFHAPPDFPQERTALLSRRLFHISVFATVLALTAISLATRAAHSQTYTTPGQFNYIVPQGVTDILVTVNGAGGVQGNANGGNGGTLTATLTNLVAGNTLTLFVGGFGAGGANGSGGNGQSGKGGEFSAIAFGANLTRDSLVATGAATTPLLVLAGGGGSGGVNSGGRAGAGGAGGGTSGASGSNSISGGGGTQTAGGGGGAANLSGNNGSFLQGGSSNGSFGGGGGGGFYGGGGGGEFFTSSSSGGGGGGSSFSSSAASVFNGNVAVTSVSQTQGGGGAGGFGITFARNGSITLAAVAPAIVPESSTFALALPALGMIGAVMIKRRKK